MKASFGVMVNDPGRLDMVLRKSEIEGRIHTVWRPDSATKGLNKLLGVMEQDGSDVAVLAHEDMFFRKDWLPQVERQLVKLPDSWIVAGIIGKDAYGNLCGRLHDTRQPFPFNTGHEFPHEASCFDECCIIVNLKKNFRFDESLSGFDLYGTLAVLQAVEMGGTAWIIDAYAEHFCLRPFTWLPGKQFQKNFKWLHRRFPGAKINSTAITVTTGSPDFSAASLLGAPVLLLVDWLVSLALQNRAKAAATIRKFCERRK